MAPSATVVGNSLAEPLAVFSEEQKSAGLFWAEHSCDHSSASRKVPTRPAGNAGGAILTECSRRFRVLVAQEPSGPRFNPGQAVVWL